jgi:hypothetical protein
LSCLPYFQPAQLPEGFDPLLTPHLLENSGVCSSAAIKDAVIEECLRYERSSETLTQLQTLAPEQAGMVLGPQRPILPAIRITSAADAS